MSTLYSFYHSIVQDFFVNILNSVPLNYSPCHLKLNQKLETEPIPCSWIDLCNKMGILLTLNKDSFVANSLLDNKLIYTLSFDPLSPFYIAKEINHNVIKTYYSLNVNHLNLLGFLRVLTTPWPAVGQWINVMESQLRCNAGNEDSNHLLSFKLCLSLNSLYEVSFVDDCLNVVVDFYTNLKKVSVPLSFNHKNQLVYVFYFNKDMKITKDNKRTFRSIDSDWITSVFIKLRAMNIDDLLKLVK